MKSLLSFLSLVLLSVFALAQDTTVIRHYKVGWDQNPPYEVVTNYNVYISETSQVATNWIHVASVAPDSLEMTADYGLQVVYEFPSNIIEERWPWITVTAQGPGKLESPYADPVMFSPTKVKSTHAFISFSVEITSPPPSITSSSSPPTTSTSGNTK